MTDAKIDALALKLCAAIDESEPCGDKPCSMCQRQAKVAIEFLRPKLRLVPPPEQHELDG